MAAASEGRAAGVIELAMVFTLGVLTVSLIALLALPIVARRARGDERLRLERRLPLSLPEIAAERDQIRAAHAVAIRQVEQRAEVLEARVASAMAEAGRHSTALVIAEDARRAGEATIAVLRSDLSQASGRAETAEAAIATQVRQIETLTAAGSTAAERLAILTQAARDAEARAREAEATAGAQAIALNDIEARPTRGGATSIARHAVAETLAGEQPTALAAQSGGTRSAPSAARAGIETRDEAVELRAALARLRTEQDIMRKSIAAATKERDRLRLRVDELLLRIEDLQEEAEAGDDARVGALGSVRSTHDARRRELADAATLRLAIAALAADLVRFATAEA